MSVKIKGEVTKEQLQNKLENLVRRSGIITEPEISKNETLSRIFQELKETNYSMDFFEKAFEHLKTMNTLHVKSVPDVNSLRKPLKFENLKFQSEEECLSYYTAKLFLDKMQLMRLPPHPATFDCPEPIETLPLQFFMRENSNQEAKVEFENSLKNRDLLYVEMTETECKGLHAPELAKLRIVARVNDDFDVERDFVYHLDSKVCMFKNLEMNRLGRTEMKSSEVLKVGVLGESSPGKRFVTTNLISLKLSPAIKSTVNLGIVPFENMPPFLKSFKKAQKFSCYSSYLRSHPQFFHCANLTKQIESLGIDPYRIYSFRESSDGLSVPAGRSTDSLVKNAKEAIHNDAKNHLEVAKQCVLNDEFQNAMEEFDKSAKCWPENYKVYELRGKMYLKMSKNKNRRGCLLKKATIDFEAALSLNPSAQESKHCLSDVFIYLSKRLIKKRAFSKATEYVNMALKIFPENKEAPRFLNIIEKRRGSRRPVDAMDLQTLERKKELLKKKLKKERR